MAKNWPYLEVLIIELPSVQDCDIALLIGYDCDEALEPLKILRLKKGPFGQRTVLGWGIIGVIDDSPKSEDAIGESHRLLTGEILEAIVMPNSSSEVHIAIRNSLKEVITPAQVNKMMELDFNEQLDTSKCKESREDKKFVSMLSEGIHKVGQAYEMPLPFIENNPKLPNNKPLATKRLNQLKVRLQ